MRLLHDVVSWWAARKPRATALLNADRGREVSWSEFDGTTTAVAAGLLRLGFRKGDYLATSLPFLTEHVLLEYACFKIGVIHAPLDLRLKPPEVIHCLNLIRPRGFAFPAVLRGVDFRELAKAVRQCCPSVEHFLDLSDPLPAGEACELPVITADDGAQVIFTTGSTGVPKPALLSHRNILCQNQSLGSAFYFDEGTRLLVNLPPSHVGGQAEALMTTLYWGGTAVLLEIFDAARSLDAIQKHRVNWVGQIPAMFQFEWRLADYGKYDLSSLEVAIYGGQQVPVAFLEKLAGMAPRIGTGLGLTEAAGFCTFTRPGAGVEDIASSLGCDRPAYPMSIRRPMCPDGSAGAELADGETGHVCFRGPQTFLGYVNDPDATARAISSDGYLYTGDLGSCGDKGLRFAGRAKWVIKPAGHQVFPNEVESHMCGLEEKVGACGVIGIAHDKLSEAIVAFVEKRPGVELSVRELRQHARSMASFKRPLYYVLLEPGQMPLNRIGKTDYVRLEEMAKTIRP